MKRFPLILLFAALICLASCQKEELIPGYDQDGVGRIELIMGGDDLFIETKSAAPASEEFFNNLVFTISGTAAGDEHIDPAPLEFSWDGGGHGIAYFKAGVYTITATYSPSGSDEGTGGICYSGTSDEFIIEVGGRAYLKAPFDLDSTIDTDIVVNMAPSNAKVTVKFDSSLKEFYSAASVNFTAPRSFSITSTGKEADVNGDVTADAYMPDNAVVSYSIICTPHTNSGAAAVELTGLNLNSGNALQKGNSYAITVRLIPGGVAIFLDGNSTPIATTAVTWGGLFS